MNDSDWTDRGTAEDHADRLEELSMQVGKEGRFEVAATCRVAANCIRYFSAKAEMLEKEADAAEKEIEDLQESIEAYDRMLAACGKERTMNDKHRGPHCAGSCEGAAYNIEIQRLRAENEALRGAGREVLDAMSQIMIRGVPLEKFDPRMDAATNMLKTMLAAHDKPVLTPAQKAGWKVGDVGRHESGAIVSLYEDLGGYDLLWRAIKNDAVFNSYLSNVERLIPESEVE